MMSRAFQGPLVLAALCAVALYATFTLGGYPLGLAPFPLLTFFTLLSIGGRLLQQRAQDPKQAVRSSMSVMALKMFASLLVLVVVVFATPRDRVLAQALTFGALYLVYLVFDTMHQFRAINRSRP